MTSKKFSQKILRGGAVLLLALLAACSFTAYDETGTVIVSAGEALKLRYEGYILVDAQKKSSWLKEHVAGSPNIERAQITRSDPVPNSVALSSEVAEAAGAAGLNEESDLLIYDDNDSMDGGRLFWTLRYYGHRGDIKVVSGGLSALKAKGAIIGSGEEFLPPKTYTPSPPDQSMMALMDDLSRLLNYPQEDVVILDVRSDEEYYAGSIPGSLHINYKENLFSDGTFKPVQHIQIIYKERGIMPDDEVILYCKSSIRAAQSYTALYNAGYRKLKIYDGAWIEWSRSDMPVYQAERNIPTLNTVRDNS
ncbi:MAG: rhodanese-like domain-containing protein [Spirochaetales bacterium]|nr:rhodanese-like domain-containing protein [Spirochaetales bacterium]